MVIGVDKDFKIWRYVDVYKLLSLLETKKLFIPVASTLKNDPLDGLTHSRKELKRLALFEKLKALGPQFQKESPENQEKLRKQIYGNETSIQKEHEFEIRLRDFICVSCWHQSEQECFGMWQAYLGTRGGVAIISSVKSVEKFLANSPNVALHMQLVNYGERASSKENYIARYFNKRSPYQYESEYRFVLDCYADFVTGTTDSKERAFELFKNKGIIVDILPHEIIHEIVVSPYLEVWERNALKQVVQKYIPGVNIKESILAND